MEFNNVKIDEFLERFCFFYDAVIREISITFRNSSQQTKIMVVLSAKDETNPLNDGWVNVIIEVGSVMNFNLIETDKVSYQVLSNGLHITKSEDSLFFDFGFFIDKPENENEYKNSEFHVIGKEFNWSITDYQE